MKVIAVLMTCLVLTFIMLENHFIHIEEKKKVPFFTERLHTVQQKHLSTKP